MSAPLREAPGFAPSDPTDDRDQLDWKSKYTDPDARAAIRLEAWYLGLVLAATPIALLLFWLEVPRAWLGLDEARYATVLKYSEAWLGGTLGGTLYALKWLYHSVARKFWHLDRRLWRIFTPHISGGLAFALTALTSSGLVRVLDSTVTNNGAVVVGLAFLVGYFSDTALAKLAEVAQTLFGASLHPVKESALRASKTGSGSKE